MDILLAEHIQPDKLGWSYVTHIIRMEWMKAS